MKLLFLRRKKSQGGVILDEEKNNKIYPLEPDVFNYFHQFTREPWHKDKTVIPEGPKKEKAVSSNRRSIESLAEEAEAYGLSHEQAMEVAYKLHDNDAARQDFKVYLIFMKYGLEGFIRYMDEEIKEFD